MPFNGRTVSISAAATIIVTGADYRSGGPSNEFGILIKNVDATKTVYLGGSAVTTAGYPLAAGEALPIGDLGDGDILYGIVSSGTAEIRILEVQ